MIYLYGLLEPGPAIDRAALARLDGVTGEIALADVGAARLVYGATATADILPRRRQLLAHARVLEALTGTATVLPMRFGMVARDLDAVASALATQSADLAAQFDTVRGCAEYGLRVSFPRNAALSTLVASDTSLAAKRARLLSAPRTGRMQAADFGRSLAEALDRRRAAAQRDLVSALAPEFAAYVLRAPEDDVQALAVDALVHESRAAHLGTRIEALARASGFAPGSEPQVAIVGPGPAYSFVRLTLDLSRQAA